MRRAGRDTSSLAVRIYGAGGPSRGLPRRPRPWRAIGSLGAWGPELRHAGRRLRRAPGFTAATVLTLAVAAGGTAAIFSVVYSILLAPLPYPAAHELVAIRSASPPAGVDDMEMTIGLYLHYRNEVTSFDSIALYDRVYRNLTADGEPARLELLQMVMLRGVGVMATGIVVGIAAGRAAAGLLASMLYQVSANDPATYVAVTVVLVAVGALAT